MTTPRGKKNTFHTPPYKTAGAAVLVFGVLIVALVYLQFRGDLTPKATLTMLASRAGLVMDPGSKVTYNGVEIGRVAKISEIQQDGMSEARLLLDVYPKYLEVIPANVYADIEATTVFGGKYVALTSPENPSPRRITPQDVIDAKSVTTEINTVFSTITALAQSVDPVKLNLTLGSAAQALSGLGDKFGQSIVNGNAILDELNPQMPQIRRDIERLAALTDIYARAAPDLWNFLDNAVITARTLHRQQDDLDAALLAAAGFGDTGADIFSRGGPYLRGALMDLLPTAKLLDTYSPEIYCTIRNFREVQPKVNAAVGGANGYALGVNSAGGVVGAPNPYLWPENLPRTNARGGPVGAPGCWQHITRHLWPAPYLVMDTGASIAPYNHFDIGSPYAIEYVWGRQIGDNTINP